MNLQQHDGVDGALEAPAPGPSGHACSSWPGAPCCGRQGTARWEVAPGGDVPPCQTIETESNERRRHRPLATRVTQGTAASAPAILNEREAVGVDKRAHPSNVVSRKCI